MPTEILNRAGLRALMSESRRRLREWRVTRDTDLRRIFTRHYRTNYWGGKESVSGPGSSLAATKVVREGLPPLLAELKIQRILDAPCGDHFWMSQVEALGAIDYLGVDIVEPLIERNRSRFPGPRRRFLALDITRDPLPAADLLLCRDALPHLTEEQIFAFLHNFLDSGIPWLLVTQHDVARNERKPAGLFRPLNLEAAPYRLPPSRRRLADGPQGMKWLALWHHDDLRAWAAQPAGSSSSAGTTTGMAS